MTSCKENDLPNDVRKLYEYMNSGKVGSRLTKRIDEAVINAKKIEEWRSAYVKEMVLLMDAREEGREEERLNTEMERRRADEAEARVRELEAMLATASEQPK